MLSYYVEIVLHSVFVFAKRMQHLLLSCIIGEEKKGSVSDCLPVIVGRPLVGPGKEKGMLSADCRYIPPTCLLWCWGSNLGIPVC